MESLPVLYINNSVKIGKRKMINIRISEEQLFIDGLVEIKKTPIIVNMIYLINRTNILFMVILIEKKNIKQNKFAKNMIQATSIFVFTHFLYRIYSLS